MTDSNTGGEATILEERRRKLEELRAENKAYINDFIPSEQTINDFGFVNGTLIPSEGLNKNSTNSEFGGLCSRCFNFSTDTYGASVVHAGLWIIRNKDREEFSRFKTN